MTAMILKPRTHGVLMQARDFAFSMAMAHSSKCFARTSSDEQRASDRAQTERWTALHQAACALIRGKRALLADKEPNQ